MPISKIYIGSDHRGFNLKQQIIQFLKSKSIEVIDCGNTVYDVEDDYPDYASEVARRTVEDVDSLGIVVCGTGVGVSIAANKVDGARSAVLDRIETVAIARAHNHINVLALSSAIDVKLVPELVSTFIETEVSHQDRHIRRLAKITALEVNTTSYE